jgi:hypothetical protein
VTISLQSDKKLLEGETASDPPKVFISYSHDSIEHTRRVRGLAEQLREHGIDASIDQYTQDPNEGWIKWMREQVKQAEGLKNEHEMQRLIVAAQELTLLQERQASLGRTNEIDPPSHPC